MNNITPLAKVDMSEGAQGYIELRNGQKLWSIAIIKDGELFKIRLDMAIYHIVDINGRVHPTKENPHDVVKFDSKMKWLSAVKEHIPTEIRLC